MIYQLDVNCSAEKILKDIKESKKKKVKELRIHDLIFDSSKPIKPDTGVYIFYSNKGDCLYVGKNSSKKFAERIPEHFVLTEDAWFNTLLKRMVKIGEATDLIDAAKKAMCYQLLIIPIRNDDDDLPIQKIESFFRRILKPTMNRYANNVSNMCVYNRIKKNLNRPLKYLC